MAFSRYVITPRHWVVRDRPDRSDPILLQYFKDLYDIFLSKLKEIDCQEPLKRTQIVQLKAHLDELLRIKEMLDDIDRDP